MVSVASLLNHDVEDEQLPTPTASSRYSSECSPAPSERASKKPKLAKDAAVFHKNKISGHVRYAPYETSHGGILDELGRLNVYPLPLSKITDFPRHIPYNSDKKQLFRKTGRDAFEVFQYTFQPPGHERPYAVLWDYNIGLVRMTPFFKCCRYPKTIPSKMLNLNPGLREICHSITGGALVAQGYWVPYAAAKALATTFCWDFRYALVPIFGLDFPDLCVKPGAETYSTMVISREIIQQCTREIEAFRSTQQSSIVDPDNTSLGTVKDTIHNKSGHSDQQYHSTFQPINRPTSVPIKISTGNHHEFLHTPITTPQTSCLSSPATGKQDLMKSLTGLRRLQIPREGFFIRDRETTVSPSSSNSPESSDSEVSPKTTRRKRGFCISTGAQQASHSLRPFAESASNKECVSQADIHAAQILVDLRTAVQKVRKDEMEGSAFTP